MADSHREWTDVVTSYRWFAGVLLGLFLLVLGTVAHAATAVDWLGGRLQDDGTYRAVADVASPYRSTVETLRTFHAIGETSQPGVPSALQYLNADGYHNTENLSLKIAANAESGSDVSPLVAELLAMQNPDGGFGELAGYGSTVLDTAFALEALAVSGARDAGAIGAAISFISSRQGSDGSFTLGPANGSSVYVTALALIALERFVFSFDVAAPIDAASGYLLQAQAAGGGWGSDWETAAALIGVAQATTDASRYAAAVTALRTAELADGSWGGDVYATALALRALHAVENVRLPAAPDKGMLAGRVIHAVTGLPLAGVLVSLDQAGGEARTGMDGTFTLLGIPPGQYTVSYQLPGYGGATQSAGVQAGQMTDLGLIPLAPLPDVGLISGIVTDATGGQAIEGALISVSGAAAASTTTDANGYFTIVAPPGQVSVTATAAGYDPVSGVGTVVAGATLNFSPSLNLAGTTPTDPQVAVKGVVVDSGSAAPLAGVLVEIVATAHSANSDSAGSFVVSGVDPGELTIDVSLAGYQTVRYTAMAPQGSIVDIGTIPLPKAVAPTTSTVVGRVTDKATGSPVAGATVTVDGLGSGAVTGSDGSYRIEGITNTQFRIAASAVGYLGSGADVSMVQHGTVNADFPLERAALSDFDILQVSVAAPGYPALTPVELSADLANTGTAPKMVRLFVKAINDANEIVDQYPAVLVPMGGDPRDAVVTVAANGQLTTSVTWNTSRHAPGAYQIVVQAFDGSSGRLLAERGTPVEVQGTNRIGGHVEFEPPIAQLAAKQPVAIRATIANRGNQPVGPAKVTARVSLKNEGYRQRTDLVELETFAQGKGLNQPRGADIDTAGNIYVANFYGHSVSKIAPGGTVSEFAAGLAYPVDVDLNDQGDVYVLNSSGTFVRVAADGTRSEVQTGLPLQQGIEALADGRVLIASRNALYEVTPDGKVSQLVSGGLSYPQGMVVDSKGDVFIASSGENAIMKYADGALSTFASGISQPYGITIDSQDNLYVTSFAGNALVKVAPDGSVSTIATGLSGPYDVKLAPDGNFVVSNYNSNEVVAITPGGDVSVLIGPTIHGPAAAVYDAAGNLYVGNNNWGNVTRFAPDGSATVVASGAPGVKDMLLADDGGFDLIEGASRVSHIAADGSRTVLANRLSGAYAIARAADGNGLLVTESRRGRISRVDSLGQVTPYMAPLLTGPRAMRTTASGDLFVSSGAGYVTKIDSSGLASSMVSELNNPYGLAVGGDGNIYVAENGKRQILKIDATGNATVLASLPFYPGAVAVTPQGHVLVAQWGGRVIYSLDGAGGLTEYAQLAAGIYYDMLADEAGNVWVAHTYNHQVSRIAADDTQSTYTVRYYPRGLAPDGQGGVFVGVNGAVKHINSAGTVSDAISGGPIAGRYVSGIGTDSAGRFWVLTDDGVMSRYNADVTLDRRFSTPAYPKGMTYGDNGELIVANGNGKILRITDPARLPEVIADGNYERLVKEPGHSVLMSNAGSVKRLNLSSGEITDVVGGFATIGALAVAPGGGFAIGDLSRNELALYGPGGTLSDRIVGLVHPKGLLFDASGALLVANSFPNNIGKESGGRIEPFSNVSGVQYMMLEPDGRIAASQTWRIVEISQGGAMEGTFNARDAYGLGRDIDGNLLVVSRSQGTLYQYATDGSYRKVASGLVNAHDVESDGRGGVFIADASRGVVNVLNPDRSLSLAASDLLRAESLTLAPDGTLFVSFGNTKVAAFDKEGNRTEFPPDGLLTGAISGLVHAGDGTLYAVDSKDNAVYRIVRGGSEPDIQPGDVVHTAAADIPLLGLDGEAAAVDLGAWTPSASGDYLVEVTVDDGETAGEVANTLHVGPNADGAIDLAQTAVFPGERPVTGYLRVRGADSTSITRIDPDGTTLAAASGTRGRAIAADSRGNIYSADYNRIVKITPDGALSDFVTGISIGNGMAVDSNDNIYAPSGGSILKISPQGEVNTLATVGGTVAAVAVGYDDLVYAVDSSRKLSRINDDGSVNVLSTTGPSFPKGLTIDAFGNFYVLTWEHRILRITPNGKSSAVYFDKAVFEHEGVNVTADCSNNLLMAPVRLLPFKEGGEEDIIVQLVGDTGEVRKVLDGPTIDPAMSDMDVLFYDRFGKRLLIWTDLYNGKIFSFPVICGGIDAEAHLATRSDVDLSSADPAPTRVTDLGDGTTEYVWVLSQVDNRGEDIRLNLLFKGLAEGERRPALKDAFLTFNNSFASGEPVRVPIRIPDLLASSAMALQPALSAERYGPDSTVGITVGVANGSDTPFDGALELSIIDGGGSPVADLPAIAVSGLEGLAAATFSSEWNTGDTYAGDYRLAARLLNAAGAQVASAEVPFKILSGDVADATVTTAVFTDRQAYEAWDTVQLNGRVRNTANNALQAPSVVKLTVTQPDGTVLYADSTSIGELYPGSYRDLSYGFSLVDAEAGDYTVSLVARDAASGAVLSTSEAAFQVQRAPTAALSGSVEVAFRQVYVGDANVCTDSVSNRGDAAVSGITVQHLLLSMDSGDVMGETRQVVDLDGGSTVTDAHTVDTEGLVPGGYACLLRADVGGSVKDLAMTGFEVTEPPIRIDAAMQLGERGRVLVLLDKAKRGHHGEDGHRACDCSSLTELGLKADFTTPLSADASVQVEAFDKRGALVDSETIRLADFGSPVDLSQGSGGADLSIGALTPTGLSVAVAAADPDHGKLGSEYSVIATVWNDGSVQRMESGPIHTSCSRPIAEGDIHGSFTIYSLATLPAANGGDDDRDPFGPKGAPGLAEQRAFLESLLHDEGWSYTIVSDREAFAEELRSGGYAAYLLLAGHVKLDEQVQKELREAVYRGEGLLMAGAHDERNHRLDDALGIEHKGRHAKATGLDVASSPLHFGGRAEFPFPEKVLRARLDGAESAASFLIADEHEKDHDEGHKDGHGHHDAEAYAAVTYHTYGVGASVYAGFDLLAQATAAGRNSPFAELLGNSLGYVHPQPLTPTIGTVVPVHLSLTNQGIATPGQVSISLPAGSEVIDAGGALADAGADVLVWPFELAEAEEWNLTFWLRLPWQPGIAPVTALIQTGTAPDLQVYDQIGLDVATQALPGMREALDRLVGLAGQDRHYKKALKHLRKAEQALNKADYRKALKELVNAADDLRDMDEPEADEIRLWVANALRIVARYI